MTLSITRVRLRQVDGRRSAGKATPPRPPLLLIGPCAAAAPLAVNTPVYVNSPDQAVELGLHGPLVEAACMCLANEDRRAILIRTDVTDGTPGAYGAITTNFASAAGPDVEGDSVVLPEDDLWPGIEIVAGGTLGTTGITYRYRTGSSLSTLSGVQALGTDTSITLPFGAGKFNFKAPLSRLVARVADVRTKLLAHVAYTTGGVHGSTDSGPYTITTPTDDASVITACGQLLTVASSHVNKISGSPAIHGAVDTTADTALDALVAPTTRDEAVAFIEAFAAIMFGTSGHTQRTTSSIHGAADTAHLLTAPAASLGVLTAGDSFSCPTTAPRWSVTELGDALDVAKTMNRAFSLIELVGPILTGVEADAIAGKVEALRDEQKNRRAVTAFRARNDGETLTAYAAAYETAFSATVQRRLCGPSPSMYLPSSHPSRLGQVDVRPYAFAFAPRLVTVDEVINPADVVGFGAVTGYVRDSNDKVLPRAVDESYQELFTPLRAVAPRTWADKSPTEIYCAQAGMLAPENSDYAIVPFARVADLATDTAYAPLRDRLAQKVLPAADGSGTIDPNERQRIEEHVAEIIAARVVRTGQAVSVRVELDPDAIIVGAPPILVNAKVIVDVYGYIDEYDVEVSLA